jgi:hypothetical protein
VENWFIMEHHFPAWIVEFGANVPFGLFSYVGHVAFSYSHKEKELEKLSLFSFDLIWLSISETVLGRAMRADRPEQRRAQITVSPVW